MKENLVKKLIDSRIIEATKKKISEKLFCIARNLGSEIIGEYGYASMLPDFWEYELDDPYDSSRVIDASQGGSDEQLGWAYDSLSTGTNLEIVVRTYGRDEYMVVNTVKANFNGSPVFLEEDGRIVGYAPFPAWEDHIEKLYEYAKVKDDERNKFEKTLEKDKRRKKTMSFLEKLKAVWGL